MRLPLEQRDRSLEVWSIHVDETTQWRPKHKSFEDWLAQLEGIYAEACSTVAIPGVVVVAMNLLPTKKLETFPSPLHLDPDFFTPPSLYVLKNSLRFPPSGEQYYRVLNSTEIQNFTSQGTIIVRSARSAQDVKSNWEFNNTLYIATSFEE